jgi:hypothetical protein
LCSLPGKRQKYIETQLEQMESPVNATRRAAQGRILYLLQGEFLQLECKVERCLTSGCFAETASPEEQLHWVMENARLVREAGGVNTLVMGLKDATRKYNAAL